MGGFVDKWDLVDYVSSLAPSPMALVFFFASGGHELRCSSLPCLSVMQFSPWSWLTMG